ncbi:MAG TPA: AarF/UbiB family protein [Acidimicrobiales bacterium]|nr:AarF/UbiB family protein [Acidimicrobiales bacterium]
MPADLAVGAFSDHPPWLLDLDDLPWRAGLDLVRATTRDEVPALTRRRRVPPWRRIVRVAWVLGRALGAWYLLDRRGDRSRSRSGLAHRLRVAFAVLGPTYIKLGQIVSSGEGIFPPELVGEFKQLRDRVPPEPFEVVREIVESDLGRPLDEVFSQFSTEPVAAASIAQVHDAVLRSGERVVVKVQRPDVAALVRNDLAVMSYLAPFLVGRIPIAVLANPPALIELFAETIVEELDFRLEAENMLDIAGVLAASDQRAIIVPRPHARLVTPRVLVMEQLAGFAWDDVDGMKAAGIKTEDVLRAGVVSFLEGAMLYGVFHGDLHGGNLFVQADGRVALLDFGITGRLTEPRRVAFLRLVMGGTLNDVRAQVQALRDLGALAPDADIEQVVAALGLDEPPQDVVEMSAEELTAQLRDLTKQLLAYGARMPKELMLFVKDIVFLDGAVATFAPDVDLLGEVAGIAAYFATRHGGRIASEIGIDPRAQELDLDSVRSSLGVAPDTERLSYREIQSRRAELRAKFERQRASGRVQP